MKRAGKKTIAWAKERAKLKLKFAEWGVTTCEVRFQGCWRDNGLSFAHAKKRRNLRQGELSEVVLACAPCHTELELLPEAEMTKIVRRIIKNRLTTKEI